MKIVLNDPVHHAQRQSGVAAWFDGYPLIGDGCRGAETRIDINDFGTALASAHDVAQFRRMGIGKIAPPNDNHVRILLVIAGVMGAANDAVDHFHAHRSPMIAHDPFDIPCCTTVARGKARGRLHGELRLVARKRIERAGGRSVLALRFLHALCNLVHCLIPADALEFAAASLSNPLHGMHDTQVLVLNALDI